MKFSIHDTIVGKPVKGPVVKGERIKLYQNGEQVNLGWGWITMDAEWADIFELITVDGRAVAPALTGENRKDEHFVEHSFALVDIDTGLTIEELKANPFYIEYAAGYYTTASHTDDAHRFRVTHVLETAITNADRMRKLYRGLMLAYGYADPSCKDASRLFYGTVNCQNKESRSNILTDECVDTLIELVDSNVANKVNVDDQIEYAPLTNKKKRTVIDLLRITFVGDYMKWRDIGWGLRSGGFALADFQAATAGMMNQKSAADAQHVWDAWKKMEHSPNMGKVLSLLRSRHGEDCLESSDSAPYYFDKFGEAKISKNIQL